MITQVFLNNKPKFTEEISKNEFSISSLENSLEKSKSNNYIKFKEMLSILKSNRENLKLKEININFIYWIKIWFKEDKDIKTIIILLAS